MSRLVVQEVKVMQLEAKMCHPRLSCHYLRFQEESAVMCDRDAKHHAKIDT
jgi:hypothetical protein